MLRRSLPPRLGRRPAPLAAGGAQAFTLRHPALQRLPQPHRVDQRLRLDLLGRGRGRGQVLRRRGAARHRGQRARATQIEGRRRERAGARGRRRLPGLAVLHHLFRRGRGRDAEPHRPRRHGLRQPRVRPRPGAAGEVHRGRGLPGALRQRRRLRPTTCSRRSPKTTWCSTIGGQKVAILGAVTTETPEIASPGPTVDVFRDPVAYLTGEVAALEAEGVDKIILVSATSA